MRGLPSNHTQSYTYSVSVFYWRSKILKVAGGDVLFLGTHGKLKLLELDKCLTFSFRFAVMKNFHCLNFN